MAEVSYKRHGVRELLSVEELHIMRRVLKSRCGSCVAVPAHGFDAVEPSVPSSVSD